MVMKAATQSCSGKKFFLKSWQNSWETPVKKPVFSKIESQKSVTLPNKNSFASILQGPYPYPELLLRFMIPRAPILSEHLILMAASVINTSGILTFHWSKISDLLKWPINLRNLITSNFLFPIWLWKKLD